MSGPKWLQNVWTNMFFLIHTLFLKWNHYASVIWKIFTASICYISLKVTALLEFKITKVKWQVALPRNLAGYISPGYKNHQKSRPWFTGPQGPSPWQPHCLARAAVPCSILVPISHASCLRTQGPLRTCSWSVLCSESPAWPLTSVLPTLGPQYTDDPFRMSRYPFTQRCPTERPAQSNFSE